MTRESINKKIILILVAYSLFGVSSFPILIFYIQNKFIELNTKVEKLGKLKDEFQSVYDDYAVQSKHRKNLFLRGDKEESLKKYLKKVNKASIRVYEKLDKLYTNPLAKEYIQRAKTIETNHKNMMEIYHKAFNIFTKDGFNIAKADKSTKGYGKTIGQDLQKIIKEIEKKSSMSIHNQTYNIEQELIKIAIGVMVGYLIFAFIIAQIILRPLKRLAKFAKFVKSINPNDLKHYKEYKKDKNDEIGDLIEVVDYFVKTTVYYSANLEDKIKKRTMELEKANYVIQENQIQLIQSEKMAVLGQLISSIANEIGTPTEAIKEAIEELENESKNDITDLINLYGTLSDEDKKLLTKALLLAKNYEQISSKDQINIAKGIKKKLEAINLDINSRKVSTELASIGIKEDGFESIKPLYSKSNFQDVHKMIQESGNNKTSIINIKISIGIIIRLIKALKEHSKLNIGEISNVKLEEGIENTLIILNHKIKQNIEVIREFEDIPIIKANEEQLNQVWTNIINNAIYVLQGNDSKLTIRLKKDGDDKVVVEIENNNGEISEDIQFNIFDPYFTTKEKSEGIGIGLSISRDIIEKKHNGKLECICKNNTTCFKATIPIKVL